MNFSKANLQYAITKTVESFQDIASQFEAQLLEEKKKSKRLQGKVDELDTLLLQALQQQKVKQEGPSLPIGFKPSPATSLALAESKATFSSAQKQLNHEIEAFTSQKLADIASRNAKSLADYNYKQALNGPYAGAVKAISAKRMEVANNGVEVFSGISGYSFKAIHDQASHQLFTFELISDPDLEIQGQSYRISKSVISPIGAGNVYHLSLVRPA